MFKDKINIPYILLFYLLGSAFSIHGNLNRSSLGFIENKGQIIDQFNKENKEVLFIYSGKDFNIQLRKNGYSYELFETIGKLPTPSHKKEFDPETFNSIKLQASRVDIEFENSSSNIEVIATDPSVSYLNYYTNGKETTNVRTFKKVTYKNIYDHIDIDFIINENSITPFKYNIILHPGANIKDISLLYFGADKIYIHQNDLVIQTLNGELKEKIPYSYYTDLPSIDQPVRFNLNNNRISFHANYNSIKTLVIDPSSNLGWGTLFGGTQIENCNGTGVDAQKNVYLTGHSLSTSNIATIGTYQNILNGNFDAYLAKFNTDGTLLWGTYFGGSSYETSFAIRVEANGNVYFSGNTASTVNVASPGAHQTVYGGGIDDGLLVKFNTNGQRLWSTYYGGNQHDIAYCLTVDINGNVIIAGHTESVNGTNAIATPGAYNTTFSFGFDAFIAKFNSSGVRQWGTYYGDSGFEEAWGVAVDPSSDIYITGFTTSISNIATFPSFQPFPLGGRDAFIAKFNSSGTSLVWGSYYGGSADDDGAVIEIMGTDEVIVGGNTSSPDNISTAGCYQPNQTSAEDIYLANFTPNGSRIWGTYFGGNQSDYIYDLLIDGSNFIFCGQTLSTASISSVDAYQPAIGLVNTYDAYFAKFNNNGFPVLSSYFGSNGNDYGRGIALDSFGHLYLAGETSSTLTANMTTPGAFMQTYAGAGDGFLAKFCLTSTPNISPAGTSTVCQDSYITLNAMQGYSTYLWTSGQTSSSITVGGTLALGTYTYAYTANDIYGCTGTSETVSVTLLDCSIPTSINSNSIISENMILPNPSSDRVSIDTNDGEIVQKIEVISLQGQLLKVYFKPDSNTIHISDLSAGVYLIKWQSNDTEHIKKLIKN